MLNNQSIHWYSCTSRCLDINHGETWNGNKVQIWTCFPNEMDQRFSISTGGEGLIRWTPHPEKCLRVTKDETSIELWDCDGNDAYQLFTLKTDHSGHIFWEKDRTRCLNVADGKMFDGNQIHLGHCDEETLNQRFFAVQPPNELPYEGCRAEMLDQIDEPGKVPVLMEADCSSSCIPGNCECALWRETDSKCLAMADCPDEPEPLPDKFDLEGTKYKVLRAGTTTLHVSTTDTTTITTTTTVTTDESHRYMYNMSLYWYSCTDRCLDISAGATFNGNAVQLWQCYPEEMDQRFSIPFGGKGQIVWTRYPNKCLQVTEEEDTVQLYDCLDGNEYQQFSMQTGHGGTDEKGHIHWAKDPSKCLDVADGKHFNGNRINLGSCEETTVNQLWFAVHPPEKLPYEGCRAKAIDDIDHDEVPVMSEGECDTKCSLEDCECALFREEDSKCLIMLDCPDEPEPLPAEFHVDGVHYKVLMKTTTTPRPPYQGRQVPYFVRSNAALPVLQHAKPSANKTGIFLQPGETFMCGEKIKDEEGVVFCKVQGHDGWVADKQPMLFPGMTLIRSLNVRQWRHNPLSGKSMELLVEPRLDAEQTGQLMPIGYRFDAIEEVEGPNGILFLHSADPSGWVVDKLPAEGRQCEPVDAEMWKVDPSANQKSGVPLLEDAAFGASPLGPHMRAGETFVVAEKKNTSGHLFVRPRNEDGWVAVERFALGGKQVTSLKPQPATWIYDPDGQVALRDPNNKWTDILEVPAGSGIGAVMQPDQVFAIIAQVKTESGDEYLQLADGRGWVPKHIDGREVCFPWPRKLTPYFFSPADGSLMPMLEEPRPDAGHTEAHAQPGEVLLISEMRLGPDGREYLKVMDRGAWIPSSKRGLGGEEMLTKPLRLREWQYLPDDANAQDDLLLLSEPRLDAVVSGEKLHRGHKFSAIEEIEGEDLLLFLKPAGMAGWVVDRTPQNGTLCKLVESEMWRYDPRVEDYEHKRPLELLNQPRLDSAPEGSILPVGSTFYIEDKKVGDHGVVFVKPRGLTTGWAFDRTPETDVKCFPLDPQPQMYIYDPDKTVGVQDPASEPTPILRAVPSTREESRRLSVQRAIELKPGTVFAVIGETTNELGEIFLELGDGRGFVPKGDGLCVPWPRAQGQPLWTWVLMLLLLCCLAGLVALAVKTRSRRQFAVQASPPLQRGSQPYVGFEEEATPRPQRPAAVPLVFPPHMSLHFKEKWTDNVREFRFEERPLGLQFQLRAPIVINGFTEDGVGQSLGIQVGMTLVAVGARNENEAFGEKIDVRNKTYSQIWELLKKGGQNLPTREGSDDYMGLMSKRPASPGNRVSGQSR